MSTLENANAFLPDFIVRYNLVFAHPPADAEHAWEALPKDCDLDYFFAAREARTVRRDHTITWMHRLLQILRKPGEASLAEQKVNVHTLPDGALALYAGKRRLSHQEVDALPVRAPVEKAVETKAASEEEQRSCRRKQMAHLHAGGP